MAATTGNYYGFSPNYGNCNDSYSLNNNKYYVSGKLPHDGGRGPNGNFVTINLVCTGSNQNINPINHLYKCESMNTFY